MYNYPICSCADSELFFKQCAALEKNVDGLSTGEMLQDVDGSLVQIYHRDNAKISVHNSEFSNSLYIQSDIDLEQFFK